MRNKMTTTKNQREHTWKDETVATLQVILFSAVITSITVTALAAAGVMALFDRDRQKGEK